MVRKLSCRPGAHPWSGDDRKTLAIQRFVKNSTGSVLQIGNARNVVAKIGASGGQALAAHADVADAASVDAIVATTTKACRRIGVLLNNAAIFATLKKRKFFEILTEEWDRVIRVNIIGAFQCAHAVVPVMRATGWGRIIDIASDAVPQGVTNYMHYVTSKSENAMARPVRVRNKCQFPVATEVDREIKPEVDPRKTQIAQQCIKLEWSRPILLD